jgi:MerR family transcriptional regulator, copper efflux regulator
MTIGELGDRFGLAPHVIRHWESAGLLAPSRRVNGRRRYGEEHLTRIAMILVGKDAGLSLEQVRLLLDTPDRASRLALFAGHHTELLARIAELQAAREMIEHVLRCRAKEPEGCPTFQRLIRARIPTP